MRVAVCEAEIAGFGASGRNGGWCSALFPASLAKLARMAGRNAAIAMYRAMQDTVDEVSRVRGGRGHRLPLGQGRCRAAGPVGDPAGTAPPAEVSEAREFGFGEPDVRLLGEAEAREFAAVPGVLGGTYTPHCAAIHPARLAWGLAQVVRDRGDAGVRAHPGDRDRPRHGALRTTHGTVRARYVIRATEGYTPALPGLRRAIVPVYSLMIATEPLADFRCGSRSGWPGGPRSATGGT